MLLTVVTSECVKPGVTADRVPAGEAELPVSQGLVPCVVAPGRPVGVAGLISAGCAVMGEVESPGSPVGMSGVRLEGAGPEWGVPLGDMASVLGASGLPSVGAWEKTALVSVAELICWEGLGILSAGPRDEPDSASNPVVSEEPGLGVETVASRAMEEVAIAEVASEGRESAGTEEGVPWPELVVLRSVTAVCLER